MIKKVTRIRCDECFIEFEKCQTVIVLTPPMVYFGGGVIEHVCKSCYAKDCVGLDYITGVAIDLTKEWKESNE